MISSLVLGAVLQKPVLAWCMKPYPGLSGVLGQAYEIKDSPQADAVVIPLVDRAGDDLDEFVPLLKSRIYKLEEKYPHAKIYLVSSSDQHPELTQQAAREAGAVLISDSGSGLLLPLYDALVASRVHHGPWKVTSVSSEEIDEGSAAMAVDGDPETYWHTRYSGSVARPPHEINVLLDKPTEIGGFSYLPRQDGGTNGIPKSARFIFFQVGIPSPDFVAQLSTRAHVSPTGRSYVFLPRPAKIQSFTFLIDSTLNGEPYGSAAELDVLPPEFALAK